MKQSIIKDALTGRVMLHYTILDKLGEARLHFVAPDLKMTIGES
jgi:hypothetical protein